MMEGESESEVFLVLSFLFQQGQVKVSACSGQRSPAPLSSLAGSGSGDGSDPRLPDHYLLTVIEFLDNNQLSVLDTYLTQVGPAAVYVSEEQRASWSKILGKRFDALLESRALSLHTVKKATFVKKADTLKVLSSLSPGQQHIIHKIDCDLSQSHNCLECLLTLLNLRHLDALQCRCNVQLASLDMYMRLDSAAMEAISLFASASSSTFLCEGVDPGQSTYSSSTSLYGSIYGLLNRCRTKMGSRLLNRWLRQPLTDLDGLEARQDLVQLFYQHNLLRDQLRDGPLKSVPDLDQVAQKFRKGSAGLEEIFRLYLFVRSLPSLLAVLQQIVQNEQAENTNSAARNLTASLEEFYEKPLAGMMGKFKLFEELVESLLDLSALPDHLRLLPTFSEDLQVLSREMKTWEEKANTTAEGLQHKYPDLRLEQHTMYGHVMRSPRVDQEATFRGARGLSILAIQKTGIYVTTKELEDISSGYRQASEEYDQLSSEIIAQAVQTAATYLNLLEAVAVCIGELDVLLAMAAFSACSKEYVRPKLLPKGSGIFNVKRGRHPCVEMMDHLSSFIPNDYDLERGRSHFQIITGPNMGGKSTYIRALGCICLLAQIGCFVPCEEATITIVDSILARVGAGDAQQKGVSTFMAEMLESAVILQTSTRNSLVIIDELGRGTSTFDGFGLAYAISYHLAHERQCLAVFATHFHEVTSLQDQCAGVLNQHVAAYMDGGQLVMLYKLQPGVCWESYGVPVARSARFPSSVLEIAQRKLDQLERSIACHEEAADGESVAKKQRREAQSQQDALDKLGEGAAIISYVSTAPALKDRLDQWIDQHAKLQA